MNENDVITFDNLPEAVMQLLQEVAYIKNHLLNEGAISAAPEPRPEDEKQFLTVTDVSGKLDLTIGSIYNMTSKQEIPHFKRGKRIYFDKVEIDEWIRNDRRKTIKQLQDEANLAIQKK
ncbi:MAG: helix-turn-helix domain-containing protein [Bacteroidota bacterium]